MTKIIMLMKSAPKWFLPQPVFIHHHLKITKMWLLCNEEFRWLFLDGIMKIWARRLRKFGWFRSSWLNICSSRNRGVGGIATPYSPSFWSLHTSQFFCKFLVNSPRVGARFSNRFRPSNFAAVTYYSQTRTSTAGAVMFLFAAAKYNFFLVCQA